MDTLRAWRAKADEDLAILRYLLKDFREKVKSQVVIHRTAEGNNLELSHVLSRSIADVWEQSHSTPPKIVESIAHAYLSILEQLSRSHLGSDATLSLCSATRRLLGAAYHRQGWYWQAMHEHQHAYLDAKAAGDTWNMVETRIWQAYALKALGYPADSLQALEDALRIASVRKEPEYGYLRARLLATAAQDAARLGDGTKARSYLYASEVLLEQLPPGEEFSRSAWLESSGICALFLGQPGHAITRLEQALREQPLPSFPHQVIRTIGLAQAFAQSRERDAALTTAASIVPQLVSARSKELASYLFRFLKEDLLLTFRNDPRCRQFASKVTRAFAAYG